MLSAYSRIHIKINVNDLSNTSLENDVDAMLTSLFPVELEMAA